MFVIKEELEMMDHKIALNYIIKVGTVKRSFIAAIYDADECDFELMKNQLLDKPEVYESYAKFDDKGWDSAIQQKVDECLLAMDYEDDTF
jgi:hypothetical protein